MAPSYGGRLQNLKPGSQRGDRPMETQPAAKVGQDFALVREGCENESVDGFSKKMFRGYDPKVLQWGKEAMLVRIGVHDVLDALQSGDGHGGEAFPSGAPHGDSTACCPLFINPRSERGEELMNLLIKSLEGERRRDLDECHIEFPVHSVGCLEYLETGQLEREPESGE